MELKSTVMEGNRAVALWQLQIWTSFPKPKEIERDCDKPSIVDKGSGSAVTLPRRPTCSASHQLCKLEQCLNLFEPQTSRLYHGLHYRTLCENIIDNGTRGTFFKCKPENAMPSLTLQFCPPLLISNKILCPCICLQNLLSLFC